MFGMVPSLILTAVGAILIWAVNTSVNGVNIHAVGWILLIVGIVGFLLSIAFWSTLSPRRYTFRGPNGPDDPYVP